MLSRRKPHHKIKTCTSRLSRPRHEHAAPGRSACLVVKTALAKQLVSQLAHLIGHFRIVLELGLWALRNAA